VQYVVPWFGADEFQVDPARVAFFEQPLAGAQQDRHHVQVDLVQPADPQQLLRDRGAVDADVAIAGLLLGLSQPALQPVGHEVEGGAALLGDRRLRPVREHEDRHLERRLLAPATRYLVGMPARSTGSRCPRAQQR